MLEEGQSSESLGVDLGMYAWYSTMPYFELDFRILAITLPTHIFTEK